MGVAAAYNTKLEIANRVLEGSATNSDSLKLYELADKVRIQRRVDFFSAPLFNNDPPPAERFAYTPGRPIYLPGYEKGISVALAGGENVSLLLEDSQIRTQVEVPAGYVEQFNPPLLAERVFDKLSRAAHALKTALRTIATFGGIHPAKIDGEWKIVLEPWARVAEDPRQQDVCKVYGKENKYYARFKELKDSGVRVVDLGPEATPSIRVTGLSGLQCLDHHRIRAAQELGMGIVVRILDFESFN